eukprot:9957251-Alexandrium_andersonii.AAC.1
MPRRQAYQSRGGRAQGGSPRHRPRPSPCPPRPRPAMGPSRPAGRPQWHNRGGPRGQFPASRRARASAMR